MSAPRHTPRPGTPGQTKFFDFGLFGGEEKDAISSILDKIEATLDQGNGITIDGTQILAFTSARYMQLGLNIHKLDSGEGSYAGFTRSADTGEVIEYFIGIDYSDINNQNGLKYIDNYGLVQTYDMERLIAHEIVHALMGLTDDEGENQLLGFPVTVTEIQSMPGCPVI